MAGHYPFKKGDNWFIKSAKGNKIKLPEDWFSMSWPSQIKWWGLNVLIKGLATGGIVTQPTRAIVGEGGSPEAVIPLNDRGLKFMDDAMARRDRQASVQVAGYQGQTPDQQAGYHGTSGEVADSGTSPVTTSTTTLVDANKKLIDALNNLTKVIQAWKPGEGTGDSGDSGGGGDTDTAPSGQDAMYGGQTGGSRVPVVSDVVFEPPKSPNQNVSPKPGPRLTGPQVSGGFGGQIDGGFAARQVSRDAVSKTYTAPVRTSVTSVPSGSSTNTTVNNNTNWRIDKVVAQDVNELSRQLKDKERLTRMRRGAVNT